MTKVSGTHRLRPVVHGADRRLAADVEAAFGRDLDAALAWLAAEMAHVACEPADLQPVLRAACLDTFRGLLVDLLTAAYKEGLGC